MGLAPAWWTEAWRVWWLWACDRQVLPGWVRCSKWEPVPQAALSGEKAPLPTLQATHSPGNTPQKVPLTMKDRHQGLASGKVVGESERSYELLYGGI